MEECQNQYKVTNQPLKYFIGAVNDIRLHIVATAIFPLILIVQCSYSTSISFERNLHGTFICNNCDFKY